MKSKWSANFLVKMPRLAWLVILFLTSASSSFPAAMPPRESIALTTWEFVEDHETNTTGFQPPVTAEWKQVAVPHVFRQSGLPTTRPVGIARPSRRPRPIGTGVCIWLWKEPRR